MRIPGDWEIKRLIEIADIKGGKRLPKGYSLQDENNGHPYITVSDMYEGGISDKNVKYVPIEVVDQIKRYRIKKGDLFISVAGTLGIVGKVPDKFHNANLTENADMITNIKIDKEYLFQVLISPIVQKEIEKVKTTSAQPKLALERIRNFTIPVPKHEKEMQKIADILSTWDKAIELKEKLIEQKKEQKKGLMQRLLTGKVRLPGFKGKWKEVKLGQIVDKIVGGGTPNRNNEEYFNGNIPWATVKDIGEENYKSTTIETITEKGLANSAAKIIEKGNLILSTRMGLGRGFINLVDMAINQDLKGIYLNKEIVDVTFFLYWYKSKGNDFERQGAGSTVKGINLSTLKSMRMLLPDIMEQKEIAKLLRCIDKELELLTSELEQLKKQKQGLMQLLLTGKVRVKC